MKKILKQPIIAVLAFVTIYSFKGLYADVSAWIADPDDYMTVNIIIPDFEVGDDPFMVYDRQIKRKFDAIWRARIYRVMPKDSKLECTGSNSWIYVPDQVLGKVQLFDWYMEEPDCRNKLKPGTHVVKTRWVTSEGVEIWATSNAFEVTDQFADSLSKRR